MEQPSPDFQVEQQEAEKPYELPSDDALLALAGVREEFGVKSEQFQQAFDELLFVAAKANYPVDVTSALSDMKGTAPLSEAKLDKQDKAKATMDKLRKEAAIKISTALKDID